jgi:hypothetical protein
MNPHYSSHISSQIPPTSSHSQIFPRVESVGIDHKVPVILVNTWRLAPIPIREEFGERTTFDRVDEGQCEP